MSNFGPLVTTNTPKGDLSRASRQRKVFWAFFLQVLRYELETWKVVRYIKFEFHHNTTPNKLNSFFFLHMASSIIWILQICIYIYKVSLLVPIDFLFQLGNFWPWWPKTFRRGIIASREFSGLFFCPVCRTSLIATRFWVVMIYPIIKCLIVLEFSFILFDLCLFITIFNFILNYVPIVTFWILTYHKIWILLIIFCFIWSYWIIYFLTCLEVFWSVVS